MLKTLALTLTLLLSFTMAACSSTSDTNAKIDQTTTNAAQTAPTDAVQTHQADTRQPRGAYRQTQWHQSCRGFFEPAATGTDLQRF